LPMANKKVTLKRVIDAQGNTDTLQPTTAWDQIEEKPTTFVPTAHTHTVDDIDSESTAQGLAIVSDGTGGAVWQLIEGGGGASVTVSATEPQDPDEGDLWFDSTDLTLYVYYDDGQSQQWVSVSGESVTTIFVDDNPPNNPSAGALWFDSSTLKLFIYYVDPTSAQWINLSGGGGASVTVDSTEPTSATEGDLWFDTTTDNLNIYYDDGSGLAWNNVVNGSLATKMDVDGLNSEIDELTFLNKVDTERESKLFVEGCCIKYEHDDGLIIRLGKELLFRNFKNATGATIPKGTPVMFAGQDGLGGDTLIKPATVDTQEFWNLIDLPQAFFGLASQEIASGEIGAITHFGDVEGLNFNFGPGSVVYFDPATGGLTSTRPNGENPEIIIGVVRQQTGNDATIFVRPTIYPRLQDLMGVKIENIADKHGLVYDNQLGYFVNKEIVLSSDFQTEIDSKAGFAISDTAPSNAAAGDLWFNSTNLTLYIYYDDGDSLQWVNAAGGLTNQTINNADGGGSSTVFSVSDITLEGGGA